MNSSKRQIPTSSFSIPSWAWLALIVVVASVLYWPGIESPPLLDDLDGLTYTSTFTYWSQIWGPDSFGVFRPVKNLIFYVYGQTGMESILVWHGMVLLLQSEKVRAAQAEFEIHSLPSDSEDAKFGRRKFCNS